MKIMKHWKAITILLVISAILTVSCGAPQKDTAHVYNSQASSFTKNGSASSRIQDFSNFAQTHDTFTTTLTKKRNDNSAIPAPPEELFDLVHYPSKVGDLAAYISSDPQDGQKHPIIIWIVGGWGNRIDDFPWVYPNWDNDQTGSAFWQAGLLAMYPSFRGGNGNPGHFEALFGEVDDVISAYEYAASLPYVDPERIYLGGHSTGGTRALLASEYADKFRAVFCFGAVDEIKYHNNSQFTFDTKNENEHIMRSPIYWLDNIKTPTFLVEGSEGNSENLKRMLLASQNENIHGFIIEGADHFTVLAPLTRLFAQKILADTDEEFNISVTQEELDEAMKQDPPIPVPVMTSRRIEELGLTFSCPYLWEIAPDEDDDTLLIACSRYEEDNPWDMSVLYISSYTSEDSSYLQGLNSYLSVEGFETREITINGYAAIDASNMLQNDDGENFYQRYVGLQNDSLFVDFTFLVHESFLDEADALFQTVIDSISFDESE